MVRLEIYGLLFDVLKKNGDMTNMVKKFNIKNKYIYIYDIKFKSYLEICTTYLNMENEVMIFSSI